MRAGVRPRLFLVWQMTQFMLRRSTSWQLAADQPIGWWLGLRSSSKPRKAQYHQPGCWYVAAYCSSKKKGGWRKIKLSVFMRSGKESVNMVLNMLSSGNVLNFCTMVCAKLLLRTPRWIMRMWKFNMATLNSFPSLVVDRGEFRGLIKCPGRACM